MYISKRIKQLHAAALIILTASTCSYAAEFFVAPDGDDSSPGTISKPFATLEKAHKAVRSMISKGVPEGGVTIYLRGGVYYLKQPLIITPEDSGKEGSPIRYTAYKNETPIVSGGEKITGWKKLTAEVPGINDKAKGNLWTADIPKDWKFHYMEVNGKQAQLSKHTDRHWKKWPRDHRWTPWIVTNKYNPHVITLTKNKQLLKYLPSNGDVEMKSIVRKYGVIGIGGMTDVNPEAGTFTWHSKLTWQNKPRSGFEVAYCIQNHISLIDKPGEFAVDSAGGKVYYWPEIKNFETANVTAHKLYNLVTLQGNKEDGPWVHHVEFSGITFTHTDREPEMSWKPGRVARMWCDTASTFTFSGAHDCLLENSTIINSGAYAVGLTWYSQRNRVEGNEIAFPGCGGIRLQGYGPGLHDVNKDNIITRNYIHCTGQSGYWHAPGIDIFQSGSNQITHNLIQRTPYAAIMTMGTMHHAFSDKTVMSRGWYHMGYDAWGWHMVRIEDFPRKLRERLLSGEKKFSRDEVKPYIHARENMIKRNIVVEPQLFLYEGGAIYTKAPGKHNSWVENVIYKSTGMPGSTVLALDDVAEYNIVKNNIVWIKGKVLCTISHRRRERGNDISGNIRVDYKPTEGDSHRFNPNRSEYLTWTESREPLYRLVSEITAEAEKKGGWKGKPVIEIPGPGEKVVPLGGENSILPEGATLLYGEDE